MFGLCVGWDKIELIEKFELLVEIGLRWVSTAGAAKRLTYIFKFVQEKKQTKLMFGKTETYESLWVNISAFFLVAVIGKL